MTAPVQTAPATGAKTTWKLDPTHTIVEFSAKHLGMMTVRGYFDEVSATGDIDPEHPESSSVQATISMARATMTSPKTSRSAGTRAPGSTRAPSSEPASTPSMTGMARPGSM